MSALGQKRTSHQVRVMSALPPKADIAELELPFSFAKARRRVTNTRSTNQAPRLLAVRSCLIGFSVCLR